MRWKSLAWTAGLAACILAACLPGPAFAADSADWPSFRNGPHQTGVATSSLTTKPRLLWTHEAGSDVESTAAIVGDTVYVGTSGKQLLALRLSDGKRKWTFKTDGAVTASPLVLGGRVFVGDEDGIFYAVSASTGKELWRFKTEDKIISSAAPSPDGQSILFGSYDNHLYKLRASDGQKLWAYESEAQVHCTPCIAEGRAIIAGCDGALHMIDVGSGKEKESTYVGANFGATPAYVSGTAFVGSMSGDYVAARVKDGKLLWEVTVRKNGGASFASAAVKGDRVIFASRNNTVFCVDRKTGGTKWVFTAKGQVDSSPVIVGSRVYVGSNDGRLYALSLTTGKSLWRFEAGAEITASPAVGRNRMVIGTLDGAIYCFGS